MKRCVLRAVLNDERVLALRMSLGRAFQRDATTHSRVLAVSLFKKGNYHGPLEVKVLRKCVDFIKIQTRRYVFNYQPRSNLF